MHAAGLNWTRIWSNSWDGKNPYVPQSTATKIPLGTMYEPALDRWDMILNECEKDDIKFQFVLFHHGEFSTTTDPNWREHPWNKANGGFLADPTDFFINPQAKELSKEWFRYAVARWGHSPAIMAWELFNEVQWVDAAKLHPERLPVRGAKRFSHGGDFMSQLGAFKVQSCEPRAELATDRPALRWGVGGSAGLKIPFAQDSIRVMFASRRTASGKLAELLKSVYYCQNHGSYQSKFNHTFWHAHINARGKWRADDRAMDAEHRCVCNRSRLGG